MIYEYDGYTLPVKLQERDTPELKAKREEILKEIEAMAEQDHKEAETGNIV